MNYPYRNNIEVVNDTILPARYSLVLQDDSGKSIYSYTSKNPSGVIAAKSSLLIDLELQVKRLGEVNFPVFVKIFGAEHRPLVVDISAAGFGPNMALSVSELNFGKVVVLKDVPMSFQLRNDSPICAEYSCAIASENSVFKVEPIQGSINPGKEVSFTVTAFLDDCLQFADMLKIHVASDSVHEIQLVARGFGSTISFEQKLLSVDFKDVLSNRECSMEFSMTNRGRRSQTIHWQGDDSKRFAISKDANQSIFDVVPNRFVLKPGGQHFIHLRGYSDRAIAAKETLACYGTIDKDPARRHILNSQVVANFINPLIDISPASLSFISVHTKDDDFKLTYKDLTLKNVSSLPLHISFRCNEPYSILTNELEQGLLLPGSSTTVVVQFDPSFNYQRISTKEHSKIAICYSEHPQKDIIEVFSEMTFPNVALSEATVDFGCIPRNTEQRRTFNMTNTSELPVNFSWCFVDGTVKAEPHKEQDPITVNIPIVCDVLINLYRIKSLILCRCVVLLCQASLKTYKQCFTVIWGNSA
jgi:hydrocephalus-inducing protein